MLKRAKIFLRVFLEYLTFDIPVRQKRILDVLYFEHLEPSHKSFVTFELVFRSLRQKCFSELRDFKWKSKK